MLDLAKPTIIPTAEPEPNTTVLVPKIKKLTEEVNKSSKTYVPYCLTPDTYDLLLVPYMIPHDMQADINNMDNCGATYSRSVLQIFAVYNPIQEQDIFAMWSETRMFKTGLGNIQRRNYQNIGRHDVPEPDTKREFNDRTQQFDTVIRGAAQIDTVYDVLLSEAIDDLLKDAANNITFHIMIQGQNQFDISRKEFVTIKSYEDFERIYRQKYDLFANRGLSDSQRTSVAVPGLAQSNDEKA